MKFVMRSTVLCCLVAAALGDSLVLGRNGNQVVTGLTLEVERTDSEAGRCLRGERVELADCWGSDIDTVLDVTEEACLASCDAEPRCSAVTYLPSSFQNA